MGKYGIEEPSRPAGKYSQPSSSEIEKEKKKMRDERLGYLRSFERDNKPIN